METKRKGKGSWGQRFFIIVLSIVLGILLFWLLGFVTDDIASMPGPDYDEVWDKHVDFATSDGRNLLEEEVQNVTIYCYTRHPWR